MTEDDEYFLEAMDADELKTSEEAWKASLKVRAPRSKLDTGADFTVIPEHIFKSTGKQLNQAEASQDKAHGP